MKELELTLTIRNNRLKARRLQLGLSQAALCKKVGIGQSRYGSLESLKRSPLVQIIGSWSKYKKATGDDLVPCKDAVALCKFYNVSFDELFPIATINVGKTKHVKEVDVNELLSLPKSFAPLLLTSNQEKSLKSPEEILSDKEEAEAVIAAMNVLTPREKRVLSYRVGLEQENGRRYEMELREIGDELGASHERIRQIQEKGLAKLRKEVAKQWELNHE